MIKMIKPLNWIMNILIKSPVQQNKYISSVNRDVFEINFHVVLIKT